MIKSSKFQPKTFNEGDRVEIVDGSNTGEIVRFPDGELEKFHEGTKTYKLDIGHRFAFVSSHNLRYE